MVALSVFTSRVRVTAPRLRMGVSAEMSRGRLGRTRGVEGVESSGQAFVSYLTALFTPFSLMGAFRTFTGLIFGHL